MEGLSSVDRAFDVLFHLHQSPGPCGVTAIGRALRLPKSSTHRLLQALTRRAVVERDGAGRYRPGIGLVSLGLGALRHEPLVALGRPLLEREVEALGETFFLVAARAGSPMVLDQLEGNGVLRAAPRIGSKVPAHATAAGKVFLAFAPGSVTVERPLPRFTDRTLTAPEALAAELARVRADGYAESHGEWIDGLSVVAAPILVGTTLEGVIAIATATPRLATLTIERVRERARAAAHALGARLAGGAR